MHSSALALADAIDKLGDHATSGKGGATDLGAFSVLLLLARRDQGPQLTRGRGLVGTQVPPSAK